MVKCLLVDIDRTVADGTHREHHLSGVIKDWERFNSEVSFDKPIKENINFVREFYHLQKIKHPDLVLIFVTGRPTTVELQTQIWLRNFFDIPHMLMCRPDRHWVLNHVWKSEAVAEISKNYEPLFFLDDDYESCKAVKEVSPSTIVLTIAQKNPNNKEGILNVL